MASHILVAAHRGMVIEPTFDLESSALNQAQPPFRKLLPEDNPLIPKVKEGPSGSHFFGNLDPQKPKSFFENLGGQCRKSQS